MVAAVVFIAFACILPEAVKPRYSEELEENAVCSVRCSAPFDTVGE